MTVKLAVSRSRPLVSYGANFMVLVSLSKTVSLANDNRHSMIFRNVAKSNSYCSFSLENLQNLPNIRRHNS